MQHNVLVLLMLSVQTSINQSQGSRTSRGREHGDFADFAIGDG
jgi:hypothetical protein